MIGDNKILEKIKNEWSNLWGDDELLSLNRELENIPKDECVMPRNSIEDNKFIKFQISDLGVDDNSTENYMDLVNTFDDCRSRLTNIISVPDCVSEYNEKEKLKAVDIFLVEYFNLCPSLCEKFEEYDLDINVDELKYMNIYNKILALEKAIIKRDAVLKMLRYVNGVKYKMDR
jgi:hypothetical protein